MADDERATAVSAVLELGDVAIKVWGAWVNIFLPPATNSNEASGQGAADRSTSVSADYASPRQQAEPMRAAHNHSGTSNRTRTTRSWYRAPIETPFGDWMAGSGQFVPSDQVMSMFFAIWSSPAVVSMTPRAGSLSGFAPPSLPAFMFGLGPSTAYRPSWPQRNETPGSTLSPPQTPTPRSPDGFVSHRSFGGHATTQVVVADDSALAMAVPLALMAYSLAGLSALLSSDSPAVAQG